MKITTTLFFFTICLIGLKAQNSTSPYYIFNQGETGYMTQLSDVASKYVLKLRPHATNSTSIYFGQGNTGATQIIQSANGPGSNAYTLSLNPFGGKVGIGTTTPLAKLHVEGVYY